MTYSLIGVKATDNKKTPPKGGQGGAYAAAGSQTPASLPYAYQQVYRSNLIVSRLGGAPQLPDQTKSKQRRSEQGEAGRLGDRRASLAEGLVDDADRGLP